MARFAVDVRGLSSPPRRGSVGAVGPTGAAGPTGATGNGAVFTSVDSLHATPRSVTDWGPIINTAVANPATRHLVFGPYDYPFTTAIDASGIHAGAVFEGSAGASWGVPAANVGWTRLIFGGTGSGVALDMSAAPGYNDGPTLRRLAVMYSSASFTGTVVDFHGTTKPIVDDCFIGYAASGQTITAALGVNLSSCLSASFSRTSFEGCLTHVRGFDTTYCNSATFDVCVFQGQCQHSIVNPGQAWKFDTCTFESVGAVDQTVVSHIQINSAGNFPVSVHLVNCAHWDASSASTTWLAQASGIDAHIVVDNCTENNAALTKTFDFQGNGTVAIRGGHILSSVDFGDAANTAHAKSSIVISGTCFAGSAALTNLDSGVNGTGQGHRNIDIAATWDNADGNGESFSSRTGIDRERAYAIGPTITVNGGAPANVALNAQGGSDARGYVQAVNNSGSTSGTGLLLDVTFAKPPALNPNFTPQPTVILTPMNATAAACQGYALVSTATPGKFTIGINVGIPGSGGGTNTPKWAYAVTWV